jgi:hypothetical protein
VIFLNISSPEVYGRCENSDLRVYKSSSIAADSQSIAAYPPHTVKPWQPVGAPVPTPTFKLLVCVCDNSESAAG